MSKHLVTLLAIAALGCNQVTLKTQAAPSQHSKAQAPVAWVVPAKGIGKFQIGLTRAQAHRLYGRPRYQFDSILADSYDYHLTKGKAASVLLWHDGRKTGTFDSLKGKHIVAIDIKDADFRLKNGLSSQSSLKRIKAAYRSSRCLVHKQEAWDFWFYTYDFVDRGIAFCFSVPVDREIFDEAKTYKVAVHVRGRRWIDRLTSE